MLSSILKFKKVMIASVGVLCSVFAVGMSNNCYAMSKGPKYMESEDSVRQYNKPNRNQENEQRKEEMLNGFSPLDNFYTEKFAKKITLKTIETIVYDLQSERVMGKERVLGGTSVQYKNVGVKFIFENSFKALICISRELGEAKYFAKRGVTKYTTAYGEVSMDEAVNGFVGALDILEGYFCDNADEGKRMLINALVDVEMRRGKKIEHRFMHAPIARFGSDIRDLQSKVNDLLNKYK